MKTPEVDAAGPAEAPTPLSSAAHLFAHTHLAALVRHAAVTTALLLPDTPRERTRHRGEYAALVDEILTTSPRPYHRARALDSLDAWGQDTTTLRRAEARRAADGAGGGRE